MEEKPQIEVQIHNKTKQTKIQDETEPKPEIKQICRTIYFNNLDPQHHFRVFFNENDNIQNIKEKISAYLGIEPQQIQMNFQKYYIKCLNLDAKDFEQINNEKNFENSSPELKNIIIKLDEGLTLIERNFDFKENNDKMPKYYCVKTPSNTNRKEIIKLIKQKYSQNTELKKARLTITLFKESKLYSLKRVKDVYKKKFSNTYALIQALLCTVSYWTDVLVIFKLFQQGLPWFASVMTCSKMLVVCLQGCQFQRMQDDVYSNDAEDKFNLQKMHPILPFFGLEVLYVTCRNIYGNNPGKWIHVLRDMKFNQASMRALPNFYIQIYTLILFYMDNSGIPSWEQIQAPILALLSLSMTLSTEQGRQGVIYFGPFTILVNISHLIWKPILVLVFSAYTRPWGFWIIFVVGNILGCVFYGRDSDMNDEMNHIQIFTIAVLSIFTIQTWQLVSKFSNFGLSMLYEVVLGGGLIAFLFFVKEDQFSPLIEKAVDVAIYAFGGYFLFIILAMLFGCAKETDYDYDE